MKRPIVFLVILFALTAACSAQWSATATTDYYSQYILVNGQSGYKKPVQQTDLTINHSGGAYLGGWLSLPYDGSDSYAREIDLTAGYSRGRYDVGFSYFLIKPIGSTTGDAWYPYARVQVASLERGSLVANLWGEVDYIGSIDDPKNNGFLLQTYGKYTVGEPSLSTVHTGKVGIMYDQGVFRRDVSLVAFGQADLRWSLGRGLELRAPNIKAFVPLNDSDIDSDIAVGAGLTYSL